jgi:FMN-dependent NADH-azoreductase
VYSSAGDYPLQNPADPSDFQKPQMRRWLRFLGIDDVHEVVVGPTLAPPQQVAALRERAVAEARQLAARF